MDEEHQPQLLEAARRYHAKGWQLIPLYAPDPSIRNEYVRSKRAKGPASLSDYFFYRFHNRSEDALCKRLIKAKSQGLMLRLGKRSGVFVLDIDFKYGGDKTVAQLNLPPTRKVITPNGFHLYYQYPKDRPVGECEKWLHGIDLIGESGEVIIPPSLSSEGTPYRWEDENMPIASFPDALFETYGRSQTKYIRRFIRHMRNNYVRIYYHRIMQAFFGGVPADWKWLDKYRHDSETHRPRLLEAAEHYRTQGWKLIALKPPYTPFNLQSWMRSRYYKLAQRARDLFCVHLINRSNKSLMVYLMRRKAINIGIITGSPSCIAVIDIDPVKGALERHIPLPLPPTRKAITPRGYHLYYALPEAVRVPTVVNLLEGIDLHAQNSYITAAPSQDTNGTLYYWDNPDQPLASLPDEWIKLAQKHRGTSLLGRYFITLRRSTYDVIVHVILAKYFNHSPQ